MQNARVKQLNLEITELVSSVEEASKNDQGEAELLAQAEMGHRDTIEEKVTTHLFSHGCAALNTYFDSARKQSSQQQSCNFA